MATFLNNISEWNAKSAVVIKDLALKGDFETASLLSSLRTTANDETLSTSVRLNALTALINTGELLDVALPPYYPVAVSYPTAEKYVGLHNDLSGLNSGNYWHLTFSEYTDVLNKASIGDINFSNLQSGSPFDSAPLASALNAKQDLIAGGSTGQFFAWDGTMRFVSWANLASKPTTLSGLGISAGDTLFDSKYLGQSSVLTSYVIGANSSVTNSDTLIGAIGKLQAQVNNVASTGGTINSVGLSMPGIFSVGNSPLTGAGGTINVSLASQSAKTFFAAPNAGSGTPTFRQIIAADLPTSGVVAGTYGNTTNWPTFTVDAYGRITSVSTQLATSGGTVTSVALSAPVEFSVSGSPVISSGTLGFSWANQTANYVMAGPVSGASAAPSFRALVSADIPNIEISQVNGLEGYLDGYLPDALANSTMFIGNGSNAAVNASATGDLTLLYVDNSGTNEAQFTIANSAVTYAKIQDVTGQKLLGRYALAAGPPQEITFDPLAFTLNSSTGVLGLVTPNPPTLTTKGDILTSTGPAQVRLGIGADATFFMADSSATTGNKWVAMSGDATIDTAGAVTISAAAVTLSKMADADAYSFIGNNTASSATPIYLTKAQATALINSFDPTADLPGLVPNGSGNDATYFLNGTGNWSQPSGSGTINSAAQYSIPYYSTAPTGIALSGLAPQTTNGVYFLRANVTASAAVAPSWIGSTGSGDVVLATSPTLITPNIGVAAATSVNGLTITSTTGTLTLVNGSTLATAGAFSTTLTATATTNVTLPTTGTLATLAGVETLSNKTLLSPQIGASATDGHIHFRKAGGAVPPGIPNYATMWFPETGGNKRMAIMWDNLGYASEFQLDATASQTYTFPNASGTVTLLGNSTTGSGNIVLATSPTLTTPSIGAATGTSLDVTGALTSGVAGPAGTAGQIVLRNATSSATQTIRGTDPTTSIIYDLPTTAPTLNQVLQASAPSAGVVTLSWANAGTGNVVGPASSSTGNFAVYADTTGTLLDNPSVATLSATGRATFNSGVDVGVSSSTTGTLVFRNATTSATTTIQASTSQTTNLIYTLPITAPGAGNILSSDISGNLSWTSAGAGNVTTGGTQTFTGTNTFNASSLRINNATNNGYHTLASLASASATLTATFPNASGTVALLSLAQTWTGAQTFGTGAFAVTSAATFSGSSTTTLSVVGSTTVPQLTIAGGSGTTVNWISIATAGIAIPTVTTRSLGTKIVLSPSLATNISDTGFGVGQTAGGTAFNYTWYSAPIGHYFYAGTSGFANVAQFVNNANVAGLYSPTAFVAATPFINTNGAWMVFGGTQAAPTVTTRSTGTKIVLSDSLNTNVPDTGFGFGQTGGVGTGYNYTWYSAPRGHYFYAGSSDFANIAFINTAGLTINTLGCGLLIKEGSNATMGVTAAMTAGTITVNTTKVTANSRIFLTAQTTGGTPGALRISARSAGTSFTITSTSATDTSTVAWIIIEPT